jgi:hypothetical protein
LCSNLKEHNDFFALFFFPFKNRPGRRCRRRRNALPRSLLRPFLTPFDEIDRTTNINTFFSSMRSSRAKEKKKKNKKNKKNKKKKNMRRLRRREKKASKENGFRG